MIVGGLVWLLIAFRMPDREVIQVYPTKEEVLQAEKMRHKKDQRKRRKKLS